MLYNALRDFMLAQGITRHYWVAYSGGMDSHVLLVHAKRLQSEYGLSLTAVHVNHHLSDQANAWVAHCESICRTLNIALVVKDISIDISQGNIEEQARVQRYMALASCMNAGDVLLTAHHQQDQAETVLLQLMRGAGPKGLSAMPVCKALAAGMQGRPWLHMPFAAIQSYADEHQLTWIDDGSNQNPAFARNYIRHQLVPGLRQYWPEAISAITRSAQHCADAQVLLDEYAGMLLQTVSDASLTKVNVSKLLRLSVQQQSLVLRYWIQLQDGILPNTKTIDIIRREVLGAAQDKTPEVHWGHCLLRRFKNHLYLLRHTEKHDATQRFMWELKHPLRLEGVGTLSAAWVAGRGLRSDLSVVVGFRRGGEVVAVPNRGRHTLKKLFQEWQVPVWEREKTPLLFVAEKCIAAVGYFMDQAYCVQPNEMGLEPHLVRE